MIEKKTINFHFVGQNNQQGLLEKEKQKERKNWTKKKAQ